MNIFGALAAPANPSSCFGDAVMQSRRFAYWWFRMMASGRFLDKFLNWRPTRKVTK
jgi:hypothetical protein